MFLKKLAQKYASFVFFHKLALSKKDYLTFLFCCAGEIGHLVDWNLNIGSSVVALSNLL